jgi:integrase
MTTRHRRPRRSWGKIQAMRSRRHQASYTGPDLDRHQAPATFTSRMDAERWLADERRLIERDEWTPPKLRAAAKQSRGKTFGEYATGWLEQRKLKPRTKHGYAELIAGPVGKLGKLPLGQMTPEHIRVWFAPLGTSTPTRNAHAYQLLRAVLNTAVSDGLIAANPANIRGVGIAKTKRHATIPTPDKVAKVALAMPVNLKALVLISAWCGLRWGEVTALTRADVSADRAISRSTAP